MITDFRGKEGERYRRRTSLLKGTAGKETFPIKISDTHLLIYSIQQHQSSGTMFGTKYAERNMKTKQTKME